MVSNIRPMPVENSTGWYGWIGDVDAAARAAATSGDVASAVAAQAALDASIYSPMSGAPGPDNIGPFPTLVQSMDADDLASLTAGAAVQRWGDRSGRGQDMSMPTAANRPTVVVEGSRPHVSCAAGQYLFASSFATSTAWMQPAAALAQPLTFCAVVKVPSSSSTNYNALVAGANAATALSLGLQASTRFAALVGVSGAAGAYGGPVFADDQWHTIVGCFGASYGWVMVDGYIVGTQTTQGHGSGTLQKLAIGGYADGTNGRGANYRRVDVYNGALTPQQARLWSQQMAAKWSLSAPPPQANIAWQDVTDAGGQAVRIFTPPVIKASMPLAIVNHQQAGTTNVDQSYWMYPLIHALVARGFVVTYSNNGGADGWGSAAAETAVTNARAYVAANIATVSGTLLVGVSMGGNLSMVVAKDALIPDLKGVYIMDAAVNLGWMYANGYASSIDTGFALTSGTLSAAVTAGATSITSTVSVASGTKILIDRSGVNPETVITTGAPTGSGPYAIPVPALSFAHASGAPVSDYPTKTAGKDPALFTSGLLPQGMRWRAVASTADTTVLKTANTDVVTPIIQGATPLEYVVVSHPDGHAARGTSIPADVDAFAQRCGFAGLVP